MKIKLSIAECLCEHNVTNLLPRVILRYGFVLCCHKEPHLVLSAPHLCLVEIQSSPCYHNLLKWTQFRFCPLLRTLGWFSTHRFLSVIIRLLMIWLFQPFVPIISSVYLCFSLILPSTKPSVPHLLFMPSSDWQFTLFFYSHLKLSLKYHQLTKISLVGPVGFNLFFPLF